MYSFHNLNHDLPDKICVHNSTNRYMLHVLLYERQNLTCYQNIPQKFQYRKKNHTSYTQKAIF